MISDNMPFASKEFRLFAQGWGFKTVTSSPQYPQSNGLAERNIQTVNQLFRKADFDCKDRNPALLDFRSVPITGTKRSPAELLMDRPLRTKLSLHPNQVQQQRTPWPQIAQHAATTTSTGTKNLLRPRHRHNGNGQAPTR